MYYKDFKVGETVRIEDYKFINDGKIDTRGHPAVVLGKIDNNYVVAKLQTVKDYVPNYENVEEQLKNGLSIKMEIENGRGESYFYFGEVYKIATEQIDVYLNEKDERLMVKDDDVINIFNLIYQKHSWLLNNHLYFKYIIEKYLSEFIDNNDVDKYLIKNYKTLEPIYKDYELNTKVKFDDELLKALNNYNPTFVEREEMNKQVYKDKVRYIQNRMKTIIKNESLYNELERKYIINVEEPEVSSPLLKEILEAHLNTGELSSRYSQHLTNDDFQKEEIQLEQDKYPEEDYSYDNFPVIDR